MGHWGGDPECKESRYKKAEVHVTEVLPPTAEELEEVRQYLSSTSTETRDVEDFMPCIMRTHLTNLEFLKFEAEGPPTMAEHLINANDDEEYVEYFEMPMLVHSSSEDDYFNDDGTRRMAQPYALKVRIEIENERRQTEARRRLKAKSMAAKDKHKERITPSASSGSEIADLLRGKISDQKRNRRRMTLHEAEALVAEAECMVGEGIDMAEVLVTGKLPTIGGSGITGSVDSCCNATCAGDAWCIRFEAACRKVGKARYIR
jgi:hypothetical protein